MPCFLILLFSCLVSYEETPDKTALSFEQAETAKAFSVRTPLSSSGKIVIHDKKIPLGHGSGNYFKSGKYKFILTAAHVLQHKFESYILDGDELIKINAIFVDTARDIAIAVPEKELTHIKPKTFRTNRKKDLIGKTIYYAGFPQDMEKCLFKGFVARNTDESIIMQGFALPGSSGSVVFDYWGRAIGTVSAVIVGFSGMSPFPELVETAVIVQKVNHIDHDFIKELFLNVERSSL